MSTSKRLIMAGTIATLAAVAACGDVLTVQPKTFYGTTNYYQTPAQIDQAVLGLYARLQGIYGSNFGTGGAIWAMTELRSDNTTYQFNVSDRSQQPTEALDEFLITPDNTAVSAIWSVSYTPILEANTILGRIDAVTYTNTAQKDQAIGEAKFNRALHYFNLVRLFGDLPVFLEEVTSYDNAFKPQRSPADSVYKLIIADAQDAILKLPARGTLPASQNGRATKGSATMLLAEVYMTRKDYQNAANALQSVLGMGYSLLPQYDRASDPAFKNNAESIFEVQYSDAVVGENSSYIYRFAPFNSGSALTYGFTDPTVNQGGWNIPTRDMVSTYEAGDLRKAASIGMWVKAGNSQYTDVAIGDTIPYIKKYAQPFTQAGRQNNNFPIFRYAEALLLYAEALNELGRTAEAYPFINQVRARAGLPALAAGLSQAAFRDAVLHEERVELAFEDKRWFDLVRTGRMVATMQAHGAVLKSYTTRRPTVSYQVQPYMALFPIPIRELTLTTFTQNPGY